MAFQSEVKAIQALGNNGQIAKGFHSYCNVVDYVAGDDISVGEFAQSSANENEVKATIDKAITGSIVGIVLRDSLKNSNTNTSSTIIPAGNNVAIIDNGNVYIETNKVANAGDYVFLDSTDGSLYFSDELEAGYISTGWRVFIGNATESRGVIGITTAKVATLASNTPIIESDDPELVNLADDNITLQSRGNNITIQGDEALWQMN